MVENLGILEQKETAKPALSKQTIPRKVKMTNNQQIAHRLAYLSGKILVAHRENLFGENGKGGILGEVKTLIEKINVGKLIKGQEEKLNQVLEALEGFNSSYDARGKLSQALGELAKRLM